MVPKAKTEHVLRGGAGGRGEDGDKQDEAEEREDEDELPIGVVSVGEIAAGYYVDCGGHVSGDGVV